MKGSTIVGLVSAAALLLVADTSSRSQVRVAENEAPAPDAGAHASALPPNVNPFLPASKRDPLDAALLRLGRVAMEADLSTNEPWLFDRATTFYKLALWSGEQEFRDHAFDLVERYYSQIDANGFFRLKPDDTKYTYVDGAVWYEHETGDAKFRPQAEAIYKLWLSDWSERYSPEQGFWTEREIAYALGSALGWYGLTHDEAALARARVLVRQWATMAEDTGAPLHTLKQHQEEFEPPWAGERMTSPWMAALFFEYLQHYERSTHDRLALELVSNYADFVLENCTYDGSENHPNLSGRLMVYYLCGEDHRPYSRETPSEGDGEHSPDIMGIMAFAVHAKRELGLDPKAAQAAYEQLRESAELFVGRRRDIDPPRKINWWFGSSYDSTQLVE